jgi:hypothetical protein
MNIRTMLTRVSLVAPRRSALTQIVGCSLCVTSINLFMFSGVGSAQDVVGASAKQPDAVSTAALERRVGELERRVDELSSILRMLGSGMRGPGYPGAPGYPGEPGYPGGMPGGMMPPPPGYAPEGAVSGGPGVPPPPPSHKGEVGKSK